jgi:hypothetical protein
MTATNPAITACVIRKMSESSPSATQKPTMAHGTTGFITDRSRVVPIAVMVMPQRIFRKFA